MKKIIVCIIAAFVAFSSAPMCPSAFAETSSAAPKPKKEYRTVVYKVHLHCKDCVLKINENIAFERGVKDLEVSLEDQTVKVTYDPKKTDEEKLAAALGRLGYEVTGKVEEAVGEKKS